MEIKQINEKIKDLCSSKKKEIIFGINCNHVNPLSIKYIQNELKYLYFVVENSCKTPYRLCSKGFLDKELFFDEIELLEYLKNKAERTLKYANEHLSEGAVYTKLNENKGK